MTFPVRFLDEIRARVALAQVIGQSVKLTRKGREYSGLCPFHNEKSPSFTVNEDKGFFHCLAAETGVLLPEGVRPIGSLAGTTQAVLTRGGIWVDAVFKSYGVQRLHRIALTRNGQTKVLHATSGHRWFVRGVLKDVLTSELKPGHRLDAVLPAARQNWTLDPAGVAHGVVFGDGSVQKGYGHVHLHGEKDRVLAGWFSGYSAVPKIREGGASYLRISGGKAFGHMKVLPSLDQSDSYLLGFLAGYIAADGHVAKDGTVMLNSADRDHLEWVRTAATKLGIGTYGITVALRKGFGKQEKELYRVHFVPSTMDGSLFLGDEARHRFESSRKLFERLRWVVASVEESDREEEVYCAEVPGEHAFALEDNILTGNCFGCGAHGDVITFLMRHRHMSFPDAVEQLAGQAGLDLPEQTPMDREREKLQAGLHDITEAAAKWFEEQLWKPSGKIALDYLHDRGLTDDTIRRFRLGWSPENRTGLKTALKAMGEPLAVEAGLLIKPEEGENKESFDRFRGRVMFPITDRRGRVIAFGGRIMGDGQPKYLNSPDTPLFHKGHNLYGWALAREDAAKTGTVLVAEGYMDVIALHQAGFGNAVAPLGTALTEEQIELMWREVAEPILCLDGDAAGQRAAIRAAERALTILKPGRSLRFATLPAPEDPDSLIKKSGPAAMQAVCDAAVSLSDTLWRVKFQTVPIATPEQRAGVEQEIKHVLGVIPEEGLKRDYIFDFIRRLREASRPPPKPRTAWQPGGFGRPQKPVARRYSTRNAEGKVVVTGQRPPPLRPAGEVQERLLVLAPLAHPGLIEEVAERLGEVAFADSNLDKLRQEIVIHAHHCASLDREAVHDYLRSRGFSQTLDCLLEASAHDYTRLTKPDVPLEEVRHAWEHVYGRYRQKDWVADVEQAKQRSAADLTDETFGFFNALWSGRDHGGDL